MASVDSSANNYPPPFWLPERNRYDTNSKIMLTAIISLSVVVLLVSLLHIYARCILRRQARRRAALRQLRIIATAHYQSTEPPTRGLDPSIVASLPKFVFKSSGGGAKDADSGGTECSVCLSSLEDGEAARKLPNCGHIFHADCIDKWLTSQSTCPICRTGAEPRPGLAVQPEPREGAIGVPVSIGPTAPPLESPAGGLEGASGGGGGGSARINGSSSFSLSSFRRILSWDNRSSKRIQHSGSDQEGCSEDLERQ